MSQDADAGYDVKRRASVCALATTLSQDADAGYDVKLETDL